MLKSHTLRKDFELIVQEIAQCKPNLSEFQTITGLDRRKASNVLKGKSFDLDVIDNLCAIYLNKSLKIDLVQFRLP